MGVIISLIHYNSKSKGGFTMKITNEAKTALQTILSQNDADGLLMELSETCCGKTPMFRIAKYDETDSPKVFNDIKVVIPEEALSLADQMMIDLVDGELVVLNEVAGGCGCSSHHEEENHGCCVGHGGCGCSGH